MIPKFRAWHEEWKEFGRVGRIRFDDEGNVSTVLFKGKFIFVELPRNKVTLMQSTGLFDKNGQEIFEGDIFGTKKDGLLNGIIEYREDLGMWTNNLIRYNNFERLCNVANSREVIGNVYQNPEFLEAEHDRN